MSDVTERAKAALEGGVTPGPWHWGLVADEEFLLDPQGAQVPTFISANTEFIAAARSLVPELVADNERLQAEVARLTPRRIDTANELDALPVGSVVRDRDTAILQRDSDGLWLEPGAADLEPVLPAVVLWSPGDAP